MMPVAYPRRIAALLLRFAIWIAPPDTLDWGHAMLAELRHVQGNWAALFWSLRSAVRLDPKLIWVYAIVAGRGFSLPEIDRWVPALERFDPQNALPHLITAEKIDIDQVLHENVPHRAEDEPRAWQSAMAAAFESARLDTYSSQRKELDRRVLIRYHVGDPELIAGDAWFYGLPSYGVSDAYRYAELVFASAQVLEVQGDTKTASEKYLAIAHFGKLLGPEVCA